MKLLFGNIPYHISTIYFPLHGSKNKNRKNNPTRICYSAFYSRHLLFFVAKTHKSITDIYIILYKIPIIQKKPRQLGDEHLSLLDVFVVPSVYVFSLYYVILQFYKTDQEHITSCLIID